MSRKKGIEVIATNRQAYHEYFILDTYEAGLVLLGAEIKSIRNKECSLRAAFVRIDKGEAQILNLNIKPYAFNTHTVLEPTRTRKLLLNRREINKLAAASEVKGQTIVPLELYIKDGWAKVKIALAKGKHLFDKRKTLKDKAVARDMERSFKNKFKL